MHNSSLRGLDKPIGKAKIPKIRGNYLAFSKAYEIRPDL